MVLVEIHDKMRHGGTICRVAIVNLTNQIGPKRAEMSAKTGTNKKKMTQCFIFLFANETKGACCVSQPRNPSIQSKTSHQANLRMKTADQIRKLFRNRPKLARWCVYKEIMRNVKIRVVSNTSHALASNSRILRYTIVFRVK